MSDNYVSRNNAAWTYSPMSCPLGNPFSSLVKQLAYEEEEAAEIDPAGNSDMIKQLVEEYAHTTDVDYAFSPATQDTAIGGNEAVNCLWQFGVDDDIVWPHLQIPAEAGFHDTKGHRGLGRVYSEMYQANQHIIWMRFGVPVFQSVKDFYIGAGDAKLASIMTSGKSTKYKVGAIMGAGIVIAVALPWWPAIGAYKFVNLMSKAFGPIRINKFYEFRPKMSEYYHIVNTLLAHLTIGMGLLPGVKDKARKLFGNKPEPVVDDDMIKRLETALSPTFKHGADIANILTTRHRRQDKNFIYGRVGLHKDSKLFKTMQKVSAKYNQNVFKKAMDVLSFSELQYVGFRIEKGSDYSDTVSNSTSEAPIASKLNAKANEGREKRLDSSAPIAEFTRGIGEFFSGMANGVANLTGTGSLKIVSSGSGYFDVPEVWSGSSMSKSYSFDIQLRARYGDPETIFQSIYIPLAMLMAGAFPIGVGKAMYTSPFLVEAYSRGLFSIPTGIIESMTIKRGLSEHGWTHDHLPTAIDVTLQIKDLSPTMYLSLVDGKLLHMFDGNDQMKLYMSTLAGTSLRDLTDKRTRLLERTKARLHLQSKRALFSPRYASLAFSDSRLARASATVWGRNEVGGQ